MSIPASWDPAAAWDRYCAAQEGPYPIGKPREVTSRTRQCCGNCLGWIEPGTPHMAQTMCGGDTGLICGAERYHRAGECLPPPEDLWNG